MKFNLLQLVIVAIIIVIATIFLLFIYVNFVDSHKLSIIINVPSTPNISIDKELIQKQVQDFVKTSIDNSLNSMNTILGVIGASLAMFTVIFGLFYFQKIKEVNEIIEKLQRVPSEFVSQFYLEQLNEIFINIFDENNVKRGSAIRYLANNPKVENKHFGIIKTAIIKEVAYENNSSYYQNIYNLTTIAMDINESEAIKTIFEIISSNIKNINKISSLYSFLTKENTKEYSVQLKAYFTMNNVFATQFIGSMFQNGIVREYADYIFQNGSMQAIQQLISYHKNEYFNFEMSNMLENIERRKDIDRNIFNVILAIPSIDNEIKIGTMLIIVKRKLPYMNDMFNTLHHYLNNKKDQEAIESLRAKLNTEDIKAIIDSFPKENRGMIEFMKN